MFLRGHIDESYSKRVFTLSCLVGIGSDWVQFSRAWKRAIERCNKRLRAKGRKPIARYHAADCSNRKNEFSDWTLEEQIELTAELIDVFKRHEHPVDVTAYSVNLLDFARVFPEIKPGKNTLRSLYSLLTKFLLIEMGDRYCKQSAVRMALIHDRCPYDAVILSAFNSTIKDPTFRSAKRFTTLVSMSWESCVPLQGADLVAYENMKEVERRIDGRRRRKSLELLLDLGSFGGRGRTIKPEGLLVIKQVYDALKSAE